MPGEAPHPMPADAGSARLWGQDWAGLRRPGAQGSGPLAFSPFSVLCGHSRGPFHRTWPSGPAFPRGRLQGKPSPPLRGLRGSICNGQCLSFVKWPQRPGLGPPPVGRGQGWWACRGSSPSLSVRLSWRGAERPIHSCLPGAREHLRRMMGKDGVLCKWNSFRLFARPPKSG